MVTFIFTHLYEARRRSYFRKILIRPSAKVQETMFTIITTIIDAPTLQIGQLSTLALYTFYYVQVLVALARAMLFPTVLCGNKSRHSSLTGSQIAVVAAFIDICVSVAGDLFSTPDFLLRQPDAWATQTKNIYNVNDMAYLPQSVTSQSPHS